MSLVEDPEKLQLCLRISGAHINSSMQQQGDYVTGMSRKAEAFRRHRGKDRTGLELLRDVFEDWSDITCALDCIDKCMKPEPTTTKFASLTGASPIRLRGGMTEQVDYISAGVWCVGENNVDEHSSPRSSPRSPRSLDINTREASSDGSDANGANCERIGSGPATTEQPFHFKFPGMLSGTIGLPRRFGNPVENASRDLKQEDMNPDSATSAEHTVKSSLRGLLRKVRVNEGLLHDAIESLGGGEKGLKVVIEFIKYFQEFEEQNAGNVSPDAFIRGLHQVCMLKSQQRQRDRVSSGGGNSIDGITDSTITCPHRSEEIDLEKQPRVDDDDDDTRASQQASIPCHMVPNEQFNHSGGYENWYAAARGHVVLPGRGGMTYLGGPPFLGAYSNFYCAYPPSIRGCSPVSPCVQLMLAPVRECPNFTTPSAESVHEEAMRRASRKSRIARRKVHLNLQQPMQQANSTTTGRGGSCGEAAVLPIRGNYEETVRPISAARQQGRSTGALVLLLQKELNPSGVSSLGRIVLPKKEAESHLPYLALSEGIQIPMEDFDSGQSWTFRYRFWSNNKSRMYLLENTRDYVKAHNLQVGDLLSLYRSVEGKYVIRAERTVKESEAMTRTDIGEDSLHKEQQLQKKQKQ